MSSTGFGPALRIRLKPSRLYRRVIYGAHILSLLPVLAVSYRYPVYLGLVPLLCLGLRHALQGYRRHSVWRQLRCHEQGQVEGMDMASERITGMYLEPNPVVFSRLVILSLRKGRALSRLPLFIDSMSQAEWKALRRFLRYNLE